MKIQRMFDDAMKVGDLLEYLEDLVKQGFEDCPIVMASDYGDHGHTEQILKIREPEILRKSEAVESCYSHTGVALKSHRIDWGDDDTEDRTPDEELSPDDLFVVIK